MPTLMSGNHASGGVGVDPGLESGPENAGNRREAGRPPEQVVYLLYSLETLDQRSLCAGSSGYF